jgi:hypothetical protein
LPIPFLPLSVNGVCGTPTIAAIKEIQRRHLHLSLPDGKVDPNGATFRFLTGSRGVAPPSAIERTGENTMPPYVSKNYLHNPAAPMGEWAGNGQCVTYVLAVIPGMPAASRWKKGIPVKGNGLIIKPGTAIATFNAPDGGYPCGPSYPPYGHAAIYEGQTDNGINVVDQWIFGAKMPVHKRMLRFGVPSYVDNGDNFDVVDKK